MHQEIYYRIIRSRTENWREENSIVCGFRFLFCSTLCPLIRILFLVFSSAAFGSNEWRFVNMAKDNYTPRFDYQQFVTVLEAVVAEEVAVMLWYRTPHHKNILLWIWGRKKKKFVGHRWWRRRKVRVAKRYNLSIVAINDLLKKKMCQLRSERLPLFKF